MDELLKSAMHTRCYTVAKLSRETRVTRPTIERILSGGDCRLSTLQKLGGVLGVVFYVDMVDIVRLDEKSDIKK